MQAGLSTNQVGPKSGLRRMEEATFFVLQVGAFFVLELLERGKNVGKEEGMKRVSSPRLESMCRELFKGVHEVR